MPTPRWHPSPQWGINHIDTAASYGAAEDRLQPWLATNRDSVFLATKTGERTGSAARAELERSLERMGVDSVDLIQLHNLVDPEGWETAFAPGGAVEALARARDEGLARDIGVTGHGVPIAGMHLRSLERFDFASVLLPINFVMMDNPAYRRDVERLLDVCADALGRRADDQVDRPRRLGRRQHESVQLVRPAHRPRADRPRSALRARSSADVPQHDERRPLAPDGGRRQRRATCRRRRPTRCVPTSRPRGSPRCSSTTSRHRSEAGRGAGPRC